MVVPLDGILDLPPGEMTVSLSRRALRLATFMTFESLQEELRYQHEVRVSGNALDMLLRTAGSIAEKDRQGEIDALTSAPGWSAREAMVLKEPLDFVPERLYVSCDGVMYCTRYREEDPEAKGEKRLVYQEMKAGAVFWQDKGGRWHKRVMGGREDPQRFALSLWSLAVRCGLLEAKEALFISDGGTWCNTVAQACFRDAIRILDWYHLSEHVWEAGRALYPEDEKAAKPWVSICLTHLHDSSGIGLLRHLERSRSARSANNRTILDGLIDYLRPRLAITDYVAYRAAGYVIGSGAMESTCKQLVGQRLKGPGMQWSESGAVAMTALIAHRINGAWDRFWASRPLQRAA